MVVDHGPQAFEVMAEAEVICAVPESIGVAGLEGTALVMKNEQMSIVVEYQCPRFVLAGASYRPYPPFNGFRVCGNHFKNGLVCRTFFRRNLVPKLHRFVMIRPKPPIRDKPGIGCRFF